MLCRPRGALYSANLGTTTGAKKYNDNERFQLSVLFIATPVLPRACENILLCEGGFHYRYGLGMEGS